MKTNLLNPAVQGKKEKKKKNRISSPKTVPQSVEGTLLKGGRDTQHYIIKIDIRKRQWTVW